MHKSYPLLLIFICGFLYKAGAQLNESFTDGDFLSNPAWICNNQDWIVNSNHQLQSNNTTAAANFFITTPNSLATNAQWEFFINLKFNTSSLNYVDVYLIASSPDLNAITTTGYFVRIGNTQDNVCLYRKDQDGTITKIITGAAGLTDKAENTLKIKATRSASNLFTLYCDISGTGNNYATEGTAFDNVFTTSSFFGFYIHQSTAAFFQKHYFDDILIQPFFSGNANFTLINAKAISAKTLDLLFSAPADNSTATKIFNYSASNAAGSPISAQIDINNNALIHLTFATSFFEGISYTLTINGLKDILGNALDNNKADFSYSFMQPLDVVMDEIMADPNPVVGLPDAEFIELKNTSARTINLSGWRIGTSTSKSSAFPDYDLPADSFLILCSPTHYSAFIVYGRVLSVPSFPALTNSGTILSLENEQGKIIHALNYNSDWYQNSLKASGGWSLEMIDTHNPCGDSNNWKPSINAKGGTPGQLNSVDGINPDQSPPRLIRSYCSDSLTINLLFNETMDSTVAADNLNYSIDNNLNVVAALPVGPLFNTVQLIIDKPMAKQKIYNITVKNLTDCSGNNIGADNNVVTGISEEVTHGDIVINEILFDPNSGGSDYVELYNNSNKIIDAGKLFIANRDGLGNLNSITRIIETPYFIFPGDYIVATVDASSLKKLYFVKNPLAVIEMSSLPTFPNDKGTVVITDNQAAVVDELAYSKDWHFALITNSQGISLERIDPSAATQDRSNWHSAASTAGYGTPTYKNSQYKQLSGSANLLDIAPKTFSPDNDGFNDFTTINYNVDAVGYVANIIIFNASGRQVRYLVKNKNLGLKGSWNWDGLDENGQKLPIGIYIIFTEIFNLEGKKEQFKNTVVLTRKT